MEAPTSSFLHMLTELLHVFGMVLIALIGGGAGSDGQPGPDGQPGIVTGGLSGALPVEIRAGEDVFHPTEPVVFRLYSDFDYPAMGMILADGDGAGLFEFTRAHVGEEVDLMVCSMVQLRPRIMEPIPGGEMVLFGGETVETITGYLQNGCPKGQE